MILLVDLGNSFLKWVFFNSGVLEYYSREKIENSNVVQILDKCWPVLDKPERILISSVASSAQYSKLVEWCKNKWRLAPERIISVSSAYGVKNCYSEPAKLGSDRWLAMIAAYQRYKGNICIIDCGTAITADIVLANGKHYGGYIVPGLYLTQQTLLNETAGISGIPMKPDNKILLEPGTSTTECIQRGAIITAVGFIEKIHNYLAHQFEDKFTYLITGGDAEYLIPHLSVNVYHVPLLVLDGLAVIAAISE